MFRRALALSLCLLCSAFAVKSEAVITYNVVQSNVVYTRSDLSTVTQQLPYFFLGGSNQTINFAPLNVLVGDSTSAVAATITIIYDMTASPDFPLFTGFHTAWQGAVTDLGQIVFNEQLFDISGGNEVLVGSSSALHRGDQRGGVDGGITHSHGFPLTQSTNRLRVKKTFILDIDGATLPSTTIASVSLIEETVIPEPATVIALTVGLGGLVLRSRRR